MKLHKSIGVKMIELQELEKLSKEKEAENNKFRIYLKSHVDEKQLDKDFKELHENIFKDYDYSK